ncbi:MAG TPA: WcaF family extracellular polysaccharide biosynthesis acetyltransferase [Flavihumibacter sp.]|jgi:putative colanic acid biosynthesis acetyltransferase WcaF
MSQTDLSKYNNDWFRAQIGAPAWKRAAWYIINLLVFRSSWLPLYSLKRGLLRLFGAKIGPRVVIKPNVNIKYPWLLSIGANTWIGEAVWIDNLCRVEIGANSCLSQGALLLTGNHNYKKTTFDLMVGPIILEDGVWIGAKSVVCPGITCHSHSVLSVGSVAASNLDAYTIYQGNPAREVRKRTISE